MLIGPSSPRLTSSRNPPLRATAVATFWVSASLRKLKTSKSVDFPEPFAPTTTARRGRSVSVALQKRR
jgi:hypothetical protein